ncbi:hypothetical protein GOBAR_AA18412 [Gossypium barbadense]|uniref:Uncharacterized protein n=1 Tax=Gossypium barbadense TaxID=3634 RepID=A0A2P5XG35_GOSBA|nr:hypothetical protein GOBAR_AA18412 [Gossypium barbadense]
MHKSAFEDAAELSSPNWVQSSKDELCHNVSKLWSLFLGMLNFLYELKMKYVMQQAFKTMTGQMNTQNNQFGNTVFPLGSPFPFPAPPSAGPDIPRSPSSQCTDTVDAPVRQVEAASVTDPATEVKSVKNETETAEPKKYLSDNGAASKQDAGAFGVSRQAVCKKLVVEFMIIGME